MFNLIIFFTLVFICANCFYYTGFGSTNNKNFGEIRKKLESTLNIITGTTRFPTNLQMHLYSL